MRARLSGKDKMPAGEKDTDPEDGERQNRGAATSEKSRLHCIEIQGRSLGNP